MTSPETLLKLIANEGATDIPNIIRHLNSIAQALAVDDNERLERAINHPEEHGLIPHTARMRLVLYQRTGDRPQLERARPTLERLQDRRHLRKLAEVEVALA